MDIDIIKSKFQVIWICWAASLVLLPGAYSQCTVLPDPTDGFFTTSGGLQVGATGTYTCRPGYNMTSGLATITCNTGFVWSSTATPTCTINDCGAAPSVANATSIGTTTTFLSTFSYTCVSGFNIAGTAVITCLASGWESAPTCTPVDCPALVAPTNGSVSGGTAFPAVANYTCDVGHTLQGAASLSCTSSATWSGVAPTCQVMDCGPLSNITNGTVSTAGGTTFSQTATYTCQLGFTMNGASTQNCNSTGSWSGSPPTCNINDCGPSPNVANTSSTSTGTQFQDTATYACITGFTGSGTTTCLANSTWSTPLPNCSRVDCGSLASPAFGAVNVSQGTLFQDVATFICPFGHNVNGPATATCQANSTWSPSPTCDLNDCGTLANPTNGAVNFTTTTFQSTADYTCAAGFDTKNASAMIQCYANGTWDAPPTCTLKDCGALSDPNGVVSMTTSTFLSSATYTCNPGFTLNGSSTVNCLITGVWSAAVACIINDCLSPPSTANGTVVPAGTTFMSNATYSCDPGFNLTGSPQTMCQANSTWSPAPSCTIKDCGPPPTVTQQGSHVVTGTQFQDTTTYSCSSGHNITGNATIQCGPAGNWSTPPTCDPVDCGTPVAPMNGSVGPVGGTTFTMVANFSCNMGFTLNGSPGRVCQANATWEPAPTCDINNCGTLPSPSNGSVNVGATTFTSTASYSCDPGFNLTGPVMTTCQANSTWGPAPTCDIKDCGPLLSPSNGSVNVGATTFTSTASYSCDPGFNLTGPMMTTCQANSTWGPSPTCDIKDCGNLAHPLNGTVNFPSGTKFMAVAMYTCDVGFTVTGPSNISCLPAGTWAPAPVCTINDCGTPAAPMNGTGIVTATTYTSVISYTCNSGFNLVGPAQASCLANKTWEPAPVCNPKDCGSPSSPTHGSVVLSVPGATTYTSTADYLCDPGYNLIGQVQTTCRANATWDPAPSCNIKDCGPPVSPQNGSAVPINGTTYLSATSHSCDTGFTLTGSVQTSCLPSGFWAPSPTCQINDCGTPAAPMNGIVNVIATTYNSVISYACDPGFNLVGPAQASCLANKTWEPAPVCNPKDCGTPPSLPHGFVTVPGATIYTSVVIYTCAVGYTLNGLVSVSCLSNAMWDTTPTCVINDCGVLSTIPVGSLDVSNGTTYESVAIYTCDPGYESMNILQRTCMSTSIWNSTVPTCTIKDCGLPQKPLHGNVLYINTKYLSPVKFVCSGGYDLTGPGAGTCQANATWSTGPTCLIKDCGNVTSPGNGSVTTVGGTTFGATVQYSCNLGYDLVGLSTGNCDTSGNWSISTPQCNVKVCATLSNPTNGLVNTSSGTTFGQVATYTCNTGYDLMGSSSRNCSLFGTWTGTKPVCSLVDCGPPMSPTNGAVITPGATTYLSQVSYSCHLGYTRSGPLTTTCQANATWETAPTCIIKDCGPPPNVTHQGSLVATGTKYQDTTTYSCSPGYQVMGGATIMCLPSGSWASPPTCDPVDCGMPPTPTNGNMLVGGTTYNMVANFTCDLGFTHVGPFSVRCQANATWEPAPSCDIEDCGLPTAPTNGSVTVHSTTTYTSLISYACDMGYTVNGPLTGSCQANGTWEPGPTCIIKDCGILTNPTNGTVDLSKGTHYLAKATFSCDTGFTLNGLGYVDCQSTGSWTAPSVCTINDCGSPSSPTHGSVVLSIPGATTYTSTADYTCDTGYNLIGPAQTPCLANSTWEAAPTCHIKDCGPLSQPQNGTVDVSNGTTYTSVVTYSCQVGFTPVGSLQLMCPGTGVWPLAPTCLINDCGSPANPPNGLVDVSNGTTYTAMVTYICDAGFTLTGAQHTTCLATSTWEPAPTCVIKDCGSQAHPTHGTAIVVGATTYTSLVTYVCDLGYNLNGPPTSSCLANATWDTAPTCIIKDCGLLSTIPVGSVDVSNGTTYESVAVYTCDPGYESMNILQRTCMSTGTWSGSAPNCTVKDCGAPVKPANGLVIFINSVFQSPVQFVCSGGYDMQGPATGTCQANGTWSIVPSCHIKDCGNVTSPGNGSVTTSGGTTFGATLQYSCNLGYNLVGLSTGICDTTGNWSILSPQCNVKDCGPLNDTANGAVNTSLGTTFGQEAVYSCDVGYTLLGSMDRVCSGTGVWTGTEPTCSLYDCGAFPTPTNGMLSPLMATTFGSTAVVQCSTGYLLNGSSSVDCEVGGWDTPLPVCNIIDCGPAATPHDGDVDMPMGTTFGETAIYSCPLGYNLNTTDTRTCELDGNWSGSQPGCVLVDCGPVAAIASGFTSYTPGSVYGSVVIYSCEPGHYLSGTSSSTCMANGNWSLATPPTCVLYDCGIPNLQDKSVTVYYPAGSPVTTYNTTVYFQCDAPGTQLTGVDYAECIDGGFWTNISASCLHVECDVPPDVDNGDMTYKNVSIGSQATYTCQYGYILDGPQYITCQDNSTWSDEPKCLPGDCGSSLPSITHGYIDSSSGTTYGSLAQYHCDAGYYSVGDVVSMCQGDGKWNISTPPTCNLIDCGPLIAPVDGSVSLNGTTLAQVAMYACNLGNELVGADMVVCTSKDTGTWSDVMPACIITDCGKLTSPANGHVVLTSSTTFGQTAMYTCDVGYSLSVGNTPSVTRTCEASGDWSGVVPFCLIHDCGQLASPAHGVVVVSATVYQSTALYSCDEGYKEMSGISTQTCTENGWSLPLPFCEIVDCGSLNITISNGHVDSTAGTTFQSMALFSCNEGYDLTGPTSSGCKADGTWHLLTSPLCIIKDCGSLADPMDGTVQYVSSVYTSAALYTCDVGYNMVGDGSRTCTSTGHWSGSPPTCNLIDCGPAPNGLVDNGIFTTDQGTTYGNQATLECSTGHFLTGNSKVICGESGWVPEVPGLQMTCQIYDCGNIPEPQNGGHNQAATTFGATVTFNCDLGYNLLGVKTLICELGGQWSDQAPVCNIVDCGVPPSPENGLVSHGSTVYQSVAVYFCYHGYKLPGNNERTCDVTGFWSGLTPTCNIIDCGYFPPDAISHGFVDYSNGTTFGSVSYVQCATGYSLSGGMTAVCDINGWSHSNVEPTCTLIDCGSLSGPVNGDINMVSTTLGSTSTFSCNTGYQLVGATSVRCQISTLWTDLAPTCVITDCGGLPSPVEGSVSMKDSTFGQEAVYSCNPGYYLVGLHTRFCMSAGLWSGSPPTCNIKDCGTPVAIHSGSVTTPSGTLFGEVAVLSCNVGYKLIGWQFITCQDDGTWSTVTSLCHLYDCGKLQSPVNGFVATKSGTTYGQVATYSCNLGYDLLALVGSSSRSCMDDGTWSGTAPSCLIKDCGPLSSPVKGVVDLSDGTLFGDIAVYSCKRGYNVDGPATSTCLDNGHWSDNTTLCKLQDCGQFDADLITNGFVDYSNGTMFGSVAQAQCSTGYRLSGGMSAVCDVDGWSISQATPMCILIDCGPLTAPLNGNVKVSTTTQGSSAIYSCHMGYKLLGATSVICLESQLWSDAVPICVVTDCGGLSNPEHGSVSMLASTFGQEATYACNPGYSLVGVDTRFCMSGGMWSGFVPTCKIKDCGMPVVPENGQVRIPNNTTYGDVAVFSCQPGYIFTGSATIACGTDGTWPVSTATCIVYDCGILQNPINGLVSTRSGTTYGHLATYSCNLGYDLVGDESRSCTEDGTWSDVAPMCHIKDCGPLAAPVNGMVDLSEGTHHGDVASYACNTGYNVNGAIMSRCEDNGLWSNNITTCNVQDCGQVPPNMIDNGYVDYSDGTTTFGSTASVKCNQGYRLAGGMTAVCDVDTWVTSNTQATCILIDCGALSWPSNGNVHATTTTQGSVAMFSCHTGYELVGTSNAICLESGFWNDTVPTCVVTDCGGLSSPLHGQVSMSASTFGQEAIYSCNTGYNMAGLDTRFCLSDGTWSGSAPACNIKDCGNLPAPTNGNIEIASGTTYGATVVYSCDEGYYISGNIVTVMRTCDENGQWTGAAITCNIHDCGAPLSPFDGSVSMPTGTTYGDVAIFTCEPGYALTGSSNITCTDGGTWSTPAAMCSIHDCGVLQNPVSGSVNTDQGTTFGEVATYMCNNGYDLTGSSSRLCMEDGMWSGEAPLCQIKDCGPLPPPENGKAALSSGTTYTSTATFSCNTGYYVDGPITSTCRDNGQWSNTITQCILQDCGNLDAPMHGSVNIPSGTTYGQEATFSCNIGYKLSGVPTLMCTQIGAWSTDVPTCTLQAGMKAVDMEVKLTYTVDPKDDLADPVTYNIYLEETDRALTRHYKQLMGNDVVDVDVIAIWKGSLNADYTVVMADTEETAQEFVQSTVDLAKGAPVVVFDTSVVTSALAINKTMVDLATVTESELSCTAYLEASGPCDIGHMCSIENSRPVCIPDPSIDCGVVAPPAHGDVDQSRGSLYGNTISYECDLGYVIVGDNTRTCQPDGSWSMQAPTCVSKDCGGLGNPTNGFVDTSSGTVYGVAAIYSCIAGYSLIGPSSVTCTADGTWSDRPPVCTITSCGSLSSPANGVVTISTTSSDQKAVYICNLGYQLSGGSVRTCLSTGWTGMTPICVVQDCGPLTNPDYGRVFTSHGTTYDRTASYSCTSIGYTLSGPDTRRCAEDGQWAGVEPVCRLQDCGQLSTPGNVELETQSGTKYGDTANFRCLTGYQLQGPATLRCQENGVWNYPVPTCSLIDCGNLIAPISGQISIPSTTYSSTALYTCNLGYHLLGENVRTCGQDALWTGAVPTCLIKDCGPLASPMNGVVDLPPTTVGETVTYTCNLGYKATGTTSRICLGSGTWSGSQPTCSLLDCGMVSSPLYGSVAVSWGTTYGEAAIYTCSTGYTMVGSATRLCGPTGTWSPPAPTCVLDCGDLVDPANGEVDIDPITGVAQYECDAGFRLVGMVTERTCQPDNSWSGGEAPTCDLINCVSLDDPAGGRVAITGPGLGTTATYTCDTGYYMTGVAIRTCLAGDLWSDAAPTCRITDCRAIPTVHGGSVTYPSGTTYQQAAVVSCNDGYDMDGPTSPVCRGNGTWSEVPTCEPIDCQSLPDPTNGEVHASGGTTFGQTARYTCNIGYILSSSAPRTCQASGQWDGVAPTCTVVICGLLTALTDGIVDMSFGAIYNRTATYICNHGHELVGTATRVCSYDGVWSGVEPVCRQIDCGQLTSPANGNVATPQGTRFGSVATYFCPTGSMLFGDATRSCEATGYWSGGTPLCIDIDCETVTGPLHGHVDISAGTRHAAILRYTCKTGYMMVGNHTRTCRGNGLWSGAPPTCTVTDCGSLTRPANGAVSTPEGTTYSKVAVYTCGSSYDRTGDARRTCQLDGTWSGSMPRCESTKEFALAVGLGVGISGFVILVIIIVFCMVFFYKRRYAHEHASRRRHSHRVPTKLNTKAPVGLFYGPWKRDETSSESSYEDRGKKADWRNHPLVSAPEYMNPGYYYNMRNDEVPYHNTRKFV